jgi:hypothetical protein
MDLRLHARQFVIARRALRFDETWTARDLPGGLVLSHQRDLAVEVINPDPAAPEILLGHRFCLDAATGRGAGRYVHIAWPHVMPDPVGLLTLCHAGSGADFVLASSPALAMLALTGEIPPYDVTEALDHRGAMNYLPMPMTRWRAVRRLFCDQKADLAAGAITHHPHGIAPLADPETARAVLRDELLRFAAELKTRIPGTVFLPLTAGLDSRTLAASFLAAGLPFEAVTFHYVGKPVADVTVAAAICRHLGISHHVIGLADPPDPEAGTRLAEHVSDAFLDWDISHLFPGDGYRYQGAGDAMIPGTCFALARPGFVNYFPENFDFAAASGAEIWAARCGESGPPALTSAFDDWRDWRRRHLGGLDWISAFYLDHRLTGWRGALEQGYDMLPAVSLNPANNARIQSAFVTPGLEERLSGRMQRELVTELRPDLMRFPFNPPSLGDRIRRLPRGFQRRLARIRGAAGGR